MKTVSLLTMVVGFILLLATESDFGISNLIGLIMFTASAYKLGVFDDDEEETENVL